jgi:hypothetical protein
MQSFSDFQMDRQVCEARMPLSYLFWDYSGRLWAAVAKEFIGIKLVNANPGHTEFEADDYLLVAEPGILRITAKSSVSAREFVERSSDFFKACIEILRVEVFDRIGYRAIWVHEYPSMTEARDAYWNLRMITLPSESMFGIEGPPAGVEARIVWESEDIGVALGLRTEKRSVEPQIPWEVRSQMKAAGSERCLLVVDADRYTKKALARDKLDIAEWIGSSYRVLTKSLSKEFFR